MEISELKIFLAVAKKGNFSRAAEEIHCVQSNITARIKQLEERLGVTLFHRKSRGVTLTSSGHQLLEYAERIIRLVKEAEGAITNQNEPHGKLLIGTMETTAAVRLPPLLATYHRSYPQVELHLVTGTSEESLKRLVDYQVDGVLVSGKVTHDALVVEKAYEEELVLVAPPSVKSLELLNNLNILVFRTGCTYRAQLEGWLKKTGRRPYQIIEFGSVEGILGCIAAGMGISCLPRSVVERPHLQYNYSLYSLPKDFGNMTTWFVWRHNENINKALLAFKNLIVSKKNVD